MPAEPAEAGVNTDVPELERELGIGFFASQAPGLGGRLRQAPEDFRVREDSAPVPTADEGGKYTLARVRARNWETNRLIDALAHQLGLPRRSIYFTGTKDKRAVTTQNLAIAASQERVQAVGLDDVEILETYRVDRAPKLGEHAGNAFTVRVRALDTSLDEARERARAVRRTLLDAGGFPNFFGPQRFGSVRPVTHRVGREIVRGRFEEAVWTYVAYPSRRDPPEVREDREELWRGRDVEAAREALPKRFDHEHRMLDHLAGHPGDHTGALTQLPRNLTRLFVSAYQSWLFNRALTRRAQDASPRIAQVGDVLHPVRADGTVDDERSIPVGDRNRDRCRAATRGGKGVPTGALPGYDTPEAGGLQGRIEAAVLDEEPVRADDFRVLEVPTLASDGTRRALWCPLDRLNLTVDEDDQGAFLELDFFLPKGCYATCLLREFMKTDPARY
jgi:tRNA pseudouridine13 synthase